MGSMVIELSDDLVPVLKHEHESVQRAALESIVLGLSRRAGISGGKGAAILGPSRSENSRRRFIGLARGDGPQ